MESAGTAKGKRGWDKQDARFFSAEEVNRLRYAQEEIGFLLDRHYPMATVIKLVGDRYQFSSRQRLALQRATCGEVKRRARIAKELKVTDIVNEVVHIDGFNLIITLEVALSGGIILQCEDGMMRDLAGLRGSYRLIEQTKEAIELVGKCLQHLGVKEAQIYLDAPISNSGRMKEQLLASSREWKTDVFVEVVNNPDTLLEKEERVVTSDGVILDRCDSYLNLARYIIDYYVRDVYQINLGK